MGMTALALPAGAAGSGWLAKLELDFVVRRGRTVLARRRHEGPLRTLRSFYPEGPPCHSYLIHPPGGIVGGDRLEVGVRVGGDAHAVITTPAANKFYRSAGATAWQEHRLVVEADGSLEWLPQEQILFNAARVESLARVDLAAGARFLGWEITALGRPASGDRFTAGWMSGRFEIWREGWPVLLERVRPLGGDPALHAAWGFQGLPVSAVLTATPATKAERDVARVWVEAGEGRSATLLDSVLVARYLGDEALEARAALIELWRELRPLVLGRPPCEPRIWAT